MKYKYQLLLTIALLWSCHLFAYDVEIDGIYYEKTSPITLVVTSGDNKYSGDIVIPDSVICDGRKCSVTSIGKKAFYECTDLSSITFNKILTYIGSYAFYGCTSLKRIALGKNITKIDDYAFAYCSSLTDYSFYVNDNTSFGYYIFAYCTSIKSFKSNAMKYIPKGMFKGCTSLSSISFPNATSIGDEAFAECTSLTGELVVKGNIGSAFQNCTGLTSVVITTSYRYGAVGGTSLHGQTFSGCSSITKVTLKRREEDFTNYQSGIIEGLEGSGLAACKNLKEIVVEDMEPNLKLIDGALYDGDNKLVLLPPRGKVVYVTPENVKTIGTRSLASGKDGDLKRVVLSAPIARINQWAFYYCMYLEELYVYCKDPKEIYYEILALEGDFRKVTLYVPIGCKEAYLAHDSWGRFWNRIEEFDPQNFDPYSYTSGIKSNVSNEEVVADYSINGNKIKKTSKGINIIKLKNGKTRKVIIK